MFIMIKLPSAHDMPFMLGTFQLIAAAAHNGMISKQACPKADDVTIVTTVYCESYGDIYVASLSCQLPPLTLLCGRVIFTVTPIYRSILPLIMDISLFCWPPVQHLRWMRARKAGTVVTFVILTNQQASV